MIDCLFCKIINKNMPSLTLYEDDKVIVILDAYPNCDGHTLVIPKKHYEDINNIDNETLSYMFKIARVYANILMTKLKKKSITYLINYGEAQKIKHLHLHLLPDFKKGEKKLRPQEIYKIIKE